MTPAWPKHHTGIEKGAVDCDAPFVFSADGYKSLYFTLDQLQSRMKSGCPSELEVDYTRTMMGFLLFNQHPVNIAMIGLGGGSLLKFCYLHLPATHFTAVEINPDVIALRHEFEVPEDPERIEIYCADGASFIAKKSDAYDVILVDGFDHQGQAPQLSSQTYYDDCFRALAPEGVMVVNRHHDEADHALVGKRIQQAFDGKVFEVASQEKSNSIFFACKTARLGLDEWRHNLRTANPLKDSDPMMRAQLLAEFARITWAATQAAY